MTTKTDWYPGAIAVTDKSKTLCFVIYFENDVEQCFRYSRDIELCVLVDEAYTIIKEDTDITLEFELGDDGNISVIYSMECGIYEGN